MDTKIKATRKMRKKCDTFPEEKNKLMVFQEKLRSIKMVKVESVTSYLSIFTQNRDALVDVGEIVDPMVLVRIALNGVSKTWENLLRGILARETMPSWERLCDDFVQEELRHGSTYTS
jgi:hypothetical protein